MSQGSYYPTLRPTPPLSGRSTPFPAPQQKPSIPGIPRSNASTPANDSFANLVSFNAAHPGKALSLQEQQRRLQEERAGKEQKTNGSQPLGQDEDFWEKLGTGRSTPNPISSPLAYTATEDYGGQKLSKTINKPFAHIDTSQNRPQQSSLSGNDVLSGVDTAYKTTDPSKKVVTSESNGFRSQSGLKDVSSVVVQDSSTTAIDDDDPFGLGSVAKTSGMSNAVTKETVNGDDDILGLLGRPVSEFPQSQDHDTSSKDNADLPTASPTDRALAELVDMGFSVDKSRQALGTTESGADVQSAVGWLLNQAHQESKSESRGDGQEDEPAERRLPRRCSPRNRSSATEGVQPAWMNDRAAARTHQQRQSSRSPVNGEKDPARVAAELGNNLFKTANSLWKTGTKKLNQAVAEFNSDSDSSQPKWMREPGVDRNVSKPKSRDKALNEHAVSTKPQRPVGRPDPGVTDEALMLDLPMRDNLRGNHSDRRLRTPHGRSIRRRLRPANGKPLSAALSHPLNHIQAPTQEKDWASKQLRNRLLEPT